MPFGVALLSQKIVWKWLVLYFMFLWVPIFSLLPLWKTSLWQEQWIVGCFNLRRKIK